MAAIHDMARELVELRAQVANLIEQNRDAETGRLAAVQRASRLEGELRQYDARTLLRCPECGGRITWLSPGGVRGAWACMNGFSDGHLCSRPVTDDQIAALLAWHRRTP